MSITVDCGENKHGFCTGTGRQAYMFPQEDRWPPDPPFHCGCGCHHSTPGQGVPCADPACPRGMPEDHPAWSA